MLRLILPLALFCALSCSKEPPPTAPAGKSNCELCDFFDAFHGIEVSIPDAALRTSIEQALGKSPGETIIQDEMNSLTVLSMKNLGIKDLRGLETAKNLTWVNIDSNRVSDITPLSDLTNLEFLAFGDNRVSDITPLANLTNLESLYFFNNQVSDISSLSALTNLESLYFFNNQVSDISSLSALTNLESLYFFNNQVSDISSLSALTNLQSLSFSDNQVSDISSLSALTNLVVLYFSINQVSDISPLSTLTNLQSLSFSDNQVSDISSLSALTNLVVLYFSINQVSDITSLSDLINLQSLSFNINQVSDISPLSTLTNLVVLEFEYNQVSDITSLSDLTNLILLYFNINQVSDISSLSDLTNLQYLDFGDNQISDISSLSALTNLQSLGFSINQVSDLTPLTNMSNLQDISFSRNRVSDLSPLTALLYLEELEALNNPLNKVSIDVHIPELQSRGVDVAIAPSLPFTETESPFNIDLVFLGNFIEEEREIWYHAANRWEAAIQTELPDYTFSDAWSGTCGEQPINIFGGEQIDDLRIYITKPNDGYRLSGAPLALRSSSLPVIGCIQVSPRLSYSFQVIAQAGLHEIGHVLGIGTIWHDSGMLRDLNGDTHFAGPQAIAAFDQASGTDYQDAKVPTERDGLHWRYSILSGELMALIRLSSGGDAALSAITLQALSDLGYSVDLAAADPYVLSSPTAAKPVADEELEFFCSLAGLPAPIYVDD